MNRPILIYPIAAVMALGIPRMLAEPPVTDASKVSTKQKPTPAPAGAENAGGAAASSAGSSTTADRTELFRSMDTNGDGKISPEEFARYQASHGGTGLSPSTAPSSAAPKAPTDPAAPKVPTKGNGDVGQSDALYNTAPSTGKTGTEAGRPAR